MDTTATLLLAAFAFGGSFIQRVTGFGFGIFIMTVLPYFLPTYGEATALSGLLAIVCSLVAGIRMVKDVPWKKLLIILPTFLIFSFFAVRFTAYVNERLIKHVLGGLLIVISIYFFCISERIRMKPNIPVQIGMGSLSGIMGGLFSIQGPPAVIYFLACTESKEEYTAACLWYFIIGNLAMTFFRAGTGFLTPVVCKAWLIGIPAVLLGLVLGARVWRKMPVGVIRKVVYIYMAFSGLVTMLS